MLAAEGSEGGTTEETLLARFVSHPELLAQDLLAHALQSRIDNFRRAFVGRSAGDPHHAGLEHLGLLIMGK